MVTIDIFMKTLFESNRDFRVYINEPLLPVLKSILSRLGYNFTQGEDYFDIFDTNNTGASLQNVLYNELTKSFNTHDEILIKFVGSDKLTDFIGSEVSLSIDALVK